MADGHRGPHAPDTDTVTVVHDLSDQAADPDPHRVAWLAAYTVGLSSSGADDRTCVDALLDVEARTSELRGAHGMLAGWSMVDAARHRRALDLIERALSHAGRESPRSTAHRDDRWVTEWSQ